MSENYRKGKFLGQGTWGEVYEAFCLNRNASNEASSEDKVAIKRIKPIPNDRQHAHLPPGLNFTALREIKHMKRLKGSPYILELIDVFISQEQRVLNLVLEFCEYDLEKIIQDKSILLETQHIKKYAKMILEGVHWCHAHFILHRDLKPANLLVGGDGNLKLADFGFARSFGSNEQLTSEVCTRWYRSPELLFGARAYGAAIDIWAFGCIFAELILRTALFKGEDNDISQLSKIFNVLGTPLTNADDLLPADIIMQDSNKNNLEKAVIRSISPNNRNRVWLDAHILPNYVVFEDCNPLDMSTLFHGSSGASNLALLERTLVLNPNRRISSEEVLIYSLILYLFSFEYY